MSLISFGLPGLQLCVRTVHIRTHTHIYVCVYVSIGEGFEWSISFICLNMLRTAQVLFSPITASNTQPSDGLDDPLAPSPPRRYEGQNRQRHGSQSRRQKKRKTFIAKSLKPVVHRCVCGRLAHIQSTRAWSPLVVLSRILATCACM